MHPNNDETPRFRGEMAARLVAARHALGLQQTQLAAASSVSLGAQKKYEVNDRRPGADAIAGYVRAGISANWLVAGIGPMLVKDLPADGSLRPFDQSLMRSTAQAVEQLLLDERIVLAPAKKADLLVAVYEMSHAQPLERATLLHLVRLAA